MRCSSVSLSSGSLMAWNWSRMARGERSSKPEPEKLLAGSRPPKPRMDDDEGLSMRLKSREAWPPLARELRSMEEGITRDARKLLEASSITSGILRSGGEGLFMTPWVWDLLAASSDVGESSRETCTLARGSDPEEELSVVVLAGFRGMWGALKVRTLLEVVVGIGNGVKGGLFELGVEGGEREELRELLLPLCSCSMYNWCCCSISSLIDWRKVSLDQLFLFDGASGSTSM